MMIYEAKKSFRENPMTTFWELKKQGVFKGNIKYSNSQFSNKHNIFKLKNSNVCFPTEVPDWTLLSVEKYHSFHLLYGNIST